MILYDTVDIIKYFVSGRNSWGLKVAKDRPKRLTVSLSQQTKEDLDTVKHTGQSYDGVIQELIKLWRREKG